MTKDYMDTLGDRMKDYEGIESDRRAVKGQPLIARLDGRAFHTYTRGLQRPFDGNFTTCMVETTKHLVREFHCTVGYTQSDEISLMWYVDENSVSDYIFSGRFQKICSILAGSASAFFARETLRWLPEKKNILPVFDCRVWQVPDKKEAANVFYWRQLDAMKNAVSMAASSYFSNSELYKKNSEEKKKMLLEQKNIDFNRYPYWFRQGTYVKRATFEIDTPPDIRNKIPDYIEVPKTIIRSNVIEFDFKNVGMPQYMRDLFDPVFYSYDESKKFEPIF